MKRFIKVLPVFAGMITLASCSNDDLFSSTNVNTDLSDKVVMNVTVGDQLVTRSYVDYDMITKFRENDVLRVYDSKMQKYDEFRNTKCENGYFFIVPEDEVYVDKKSENGPYDYTYALFGADENNISYAGWKNGKNVALLRINGSYNYDEKESLTDEGVVTYKSIIPMFGNVKNVVSEHQTDNKSFDVTIYQLAGSVRIVFENGNGLKVNKVRARSVNIKAESKDAFAALTLTKKQPTADLEQYLDSTNAPKLTGWFEAVLDPEIGNAKGDGLRPVTENSINNAGASTIIEVDVDENTMKDYTNVVSFPIVPGEYELILFEYSTDDGSTWNYITRLYNRTGDNKIQRWFTGGTTISENVSADNITQPGIGVNSDGDIYGLQSLLEKYASLGKAMEISVNGTSGTIDVKDFNEAREQFHTLVVPKLAENITLNIGGSITGTGKTLYVQGGGGKGTLTINYIGDDAAEPNIDITAANNVVLKSINNETYTAGYAGAITVETTTDVELDGKFAGNVTINQVGSLTLGGEFSEAVTSPEDMAGDIIVSGKYSKGAKLSTKGNITVGNVNDNTMKGADKQLDLTAENITIEGKVYTLATAGETTLASTGSVNHSWAHSGGDLTINGKVSGGTLTVKDGEVTVAESGSVATLTLAAGATSATIEGNVSSTLTTNGATININGVTVKNLNVNAPVAGDGIVLNGGVIEKIKGYTGEDAVKTTVKSVGTADIKTVTAGDNFTFKSTIDDETEPVSLTTDNETVNIYTGAQLLSLQGTTTVSATTINLNTEVIATNVEWTPSAVLTNKATTFNGNKNIISGLKIVTGTTTSSKQNVAFFSKAANNSNITIKDLELRGLSYDGQATSIVAGLVGTVNAALTIENVNVSGDKLYGANDVFCVGGLIARANTGDVTIKNSTVTFDEIAGKQYVGGLIGDDYNASETTKTITVTGGEKNLVTLTALTSSTNATTANIATFGMLVGAVRNAGTTLTITGEKLYNTNLIAGNRDKYLYDKRTYTQDNVTFKFFGVEDNYVGFCAPYDYSNDSNNRNQKTKVTIGTKTYSWNELNQFKSTYDWIK